MRQAVTTIASMAVAILVLCGQALSQDVCAELAGQADRSIREQYQHSIDYFLKVSAGAQAKGYDPRNFPQADDTGQVQSLNLVLIVEQLTAKRDEGIAAIYQSFVECRNGFAPFQKIVDVGSFFLFGAAQQVVPRAALFIDSSRLLAGTPFGGRNALVPQTREWIFARLGIGGDVADFIRNPLQIGGAGPFRAPWNPIFLPPLPGISGIPQLPNIRLPNLPPLPAVPSPQPLEVGRIGGTRICVPWC